MSTKCVSNNSQIPSPPPHFILTGCLDLEPEKPRPPNEAELHTLPEIYYCLALAVCVCRLSGEKALRKEVDRLTKLTTDRDHSIVKLK